MKSKLSNKNLGPISCTSLKQPVYTYYQRRESCSNYIRLIQLNFPDYETNMMSDNETETT